MLKLPLVLIFAALASAAALTTSRPAHAAPATPCADVDGSSCSASAPCGQGLSYVCYTTLTYTCMDWVYSVDGSTRICRWYAWVTRYYYRD